MVKGKSGKHIFMLYRLNKLPAVFAHATMQAIGLADVEPNDQAQGAAIFSIPNQTREEHEMRTFTAVIERCSDTGFYVGYVPGFPGAHSQAETLEELNENLREVIEMLLEDGEPKLEHQFIGTQNVVVS